MKSLMLRYPVLLIIGIAILSRIPMMLGPHFFLDGDECLEGLMARMMIQRNDFSLFPWGQLYGFSIIETIAIIPFYTLLSYTTLAVKLGVLTVWITGVVFMYKTFCVITDDKGSAFCLAILFILFPAWNAPSMKAYGGYTTAFMFSNVLLYWLLNDSVKKTLRYYIVIGILLVLIAESQRLWLVGVLPFTGYKLWNDKKWKETGIVIFAGILALVFFHYYKEDIQVAHHMPIVPPTSDRLVWLIVRFPEYLYNSLHGDYYFNQYQPPSLFNGMYAIVGTVVFSLLLLIGIYQLIFAGNKNKLFITSVAFIPLCFGYTLFTHVMEGRYLLPVSGFMFIAIAIFLKDYTLHKGAKIIIGALTILGVGSCISFYNFSEISKDYKKSVLETVSYLQANDIHYSYSTDAMLPYQIMFYSDEKIMCRMPFQPARYQPYSDAVDSAFDKGAKTAMLQYQGLTMNMNFIFDKKTPDIAICINPPISEMWKGIEFRHIHAK